MISRSDTYLTATVSMEFDATVQLPSPARDAVTGQTTSTLVLDDPPARYAVEAGYDAAGAFVFNQYSLDPPGDPLTQSVSPAQTVSLHNGRFEFFDDGGEPILGTGTGSGPSLQTMMNAPSSEALQLLDEMVLSKAPLTGTTTDFDGASVTVTSVSQSGDLVTVQAQISTPEPGLPTLPQRRTYRQTFVGGAERLTLLEVRTDIATSAGASQVSGTAIIRVDGLQFSRSAAGDQLRASGAAGSAFGSAPANIGPYIPPSCEPDDPYCDPADPGTGGNGGGGPNGGSQPGCGYVTGGANLVFVHGILIGGDTWGDPAYDNRIRGRTRCGFAVANDIAPTLSQGSRHSTQTTELRTAVAASGAQQNIFIGHSQGGLISRRAAQSYTLDTLPGTTTANPSYQPSRVRGLVTIGTPHVGANIARNLPTNVLEDVITVFAQPLACRITGSCSLLSAGLTALRQTVLTGVGVSAADALSDLRPESGALTEVNGVSEGPLFPRYGIQHYASKRWMPMRLAGDYVSNPQGLGPLFVGIADAAFLVASGGAIIGFFTGHWAFTLACVRFMRAMLNTDNWWARLTAGNDRTDGVVEGTSQVYPGAILNFAARSPTSHLGETDTERSYVELNDVLRNQLLVAPRQ